MCFFFGGSCWVNPLFTMAVCCFFLPETRDKLWFLAKMLQIAVTWPWLQMAVNTSRLPSGQNVDTWLRGAAIRTLNSGFKCLCRGRVHCNFNWLLSNQLTYLCSREKAPKILEEACRMPSLIDSQAYSNCIFSLFFLLDSFITVNPFRHLVVYSSEKQT